MYRVRFLIVGSLGIFLGGCYYFPDFETTPSARLPVSEVVNQIRCDMYQFLLEHRAGTATFSLDENSYATVELSLSTTAFGDVKFSKIDTVRLGATGFLAIGSSSQPFPSIGAKQASQVVTKVTVNISQDPKNLKDLCEYGYQYGHGEILSDGKYADRVLVNKLRIGAWLSRTFESSKRIVHRSKGYYCNARSKEAKAPLETCSSSLETATLTTKFQLVGDVSGGVLDLAKLIPVVATPTLQLNADYFHQIQVIFAGNNVVDKSKTGTLTQAPQVPVDVPAIGPEVAPAKECDEKDQSEAGKVCRDLQGLRRQNKILNEQLKTGLKALKEKQDEIDARTAGDSATITRQLRSIRDALILNGNRP